MDGPPAAPEAIVRFWLRSDGGSDPGYRHRRTLDDRAERPDPAWVARGLRTPPRKALLAEAVTPDCYGRAFGFERTMDTLGAVLAPVATLLLLKAGFAPRNLMLWATLPALLAVLAITAFVRETPARDACAPAAGQLP